MSYLDHAATTPIRPAALAAFVEAAGRTGNPGSVHGPGRAARRLLEDARELVAARLGARPDEVVLTGSGTEADNLAVAGLFHARSADDPQRRRVLVSAVEHPAVLESSRALPGAVVVEIPVDAAGRVELPALAAELAANGEHTALVSVMWANNEIGTVQPVAEVVALAAAHGVPVHSDAVQAVGHLPVDVAASGVAALSLSGHKLGGPSGVGALVVRRGVTLRPVLHGGGQERGLRSGTPAVASVRAMAVALDEAVGSRSAEAARVAGLRDRLLVGVRAVVPDVELSGPVGTGPGERLPGVLHVRIPGTQADALLFLLDDCGIAASAGSACHAGVTRPSHVLAACGVDDRSARGALRLSLGWTSTEQEVDHLLAVLPQVVSRARAAARVS